MSTRLARVAPAATALLAGALLPLAFAPFGWWPVAPLSFAVFTALLGTCTARAALWRGWAYGLGMFGTGASWVYVSIHDYGAAPVPLAAFLTLLFCAGLALFPALCAWTWTRWLRARRGSVLFGIPALWVLIEWLRGWILTGFPWLYLGYSQMDGPLAPWAPVAGVFGLGLIVAATGSALHILWERALRAMNRGQGPLLRGGSPHDAAGARHARDDREQEPLLHGGSPIEAVGARHARDDRGQGPLLRGGLPHEPVGARLARDRLGDTPAVWLGLAAVALLWLAAWPLGRFEWTQPRGEPRSVALVQGNIPQLLKWDPKHLNNTLAIYAELSAPLWGTDFVVWPESAVPAYLDLVTDFLSQQATQATGAGSALLLGIPTRDADGSDKRGYATYNSVIALGADSGMYHKRRLVPFGEYVPLEGLLRGLIAFFDLPMSGFSRGAEAQDMLQAHATAIGTFVCYEIAYPDLVRTALPQAGLLLTVSNDTWFGASAGPLQHLEIARMRALENGRDLIRGTNNGVSALIDARGRITARGGQFTREVVSGSVQPRSGLTPFARLGSWPVILLCAAMLAMVLRTRPTA